MLEISNHISVEFPRLPAHYLKGTHGNSDNTPAQDEHDSSCKNGSPLLVFINSGSGGHVGEQLAEYFKQALGSAQVYFPLARLGEPYP